MRFYKTSEVAKVVGVTKETLYKWLRQGKIPEPDRDYRNYRIWTEADIRNCLKYKNRRVPGIKVVRGRASSSF